MAVAFDASLGLCFAVPGDDAMERVRSGLYSCRLADPVGVPAPVLQDFLGHHAKQEGAHGLGRTLRSLILEHGHS